MRRMRKWARRLAIAVAVTVAGLLWLALVSIVFLDTERGREWARPRVEGLASRAMPGTLRIGRIERASPAWIALEDVVVFDPEGREVLRVESLEGRPSKRALLGGVVGFESVRAKGVKARLIPSETGGLTLIDAFDEGRDEEPGARPSAPLEIRVERFRIESAEARLELEELPLDLREVTIVGRVRSKESLDLVVERAALRIEHGGAVVFRARDVEGAYRTAPGARSELRALLVEAEDRVRLRAESLAPSEGAGEDAPSAFEAELELDPLTPRALAALDRGDLARELPKRARGRVSVRGTSERVRFDARLEVAGSRLRAEGVYTPRDSRAELCARRLRLDRLHASLPGVTIDGCARLGVGDLGAGSFPARLEVRGLRVDGDPVPDARVSGRVDVESQVLSVRSLDLPRAEGPGEQLDVEGRATSRGEVDLRLEARGFDPGGDPALAALLGGARGTIDAEGTLSLRPGPPSRVDASLEATVAGPRVAGVRARRLVVSARAEGATEAPRFEVRGAARDLSSGGFEARRLRFSASGTPDAAAFVVRGDLGEGEPVAVRFRARREGSRYAIDGSGALGGEDEELRFRVVGLRLDPERDRAELRALRLAHRGGRALVRGAVEGETIDVRAWIAELPLEALAGGAPGAGPLEGELSGTLALGGTRASPRAWAKLRLDDAKGYGVARAKATLVASLGPTGASLRFSGSAPRRGEVELHADARWPRRGDLEGALRAARYEARLRLDTPERDAQLNARWDRSGLLAAVVATDERGGLGAASLRSEATPRALAPGFDPLDFAFEAEAQLFERPIADLPWRRPAWLDPALRVGGSASLAHRPRRPIEGELHASLRGDLGPMAAPEDDCSGVGEIAARIDATLGDDRANAKVEATLAGERRARAELEATLPLARILRGRAGLDEARGAVEGQIAGLDLRTFPVLCEMGVGKVDVELAGKDLGGPEADVRLSLTSRGARLGPEAIFDVDAEVRAADGKATARLRMTSDVGGSARFDAAAPFTFGPDGLSPAIPSGEVSLSSRFDRLTLEPFAPISRFVRHQAGTLDGELEVSGTKEAPVAVGELALHDSTLVVPVLDQRLSELEVRVRFTPGWVMVDELSGRDLDGSLAMRGSAELDGLLPRSASLTIEASRLPIRREGVVAAALDARARARFAGADDGMDGVLRFERLAVRLPSEGGRDVQDLAENPDIVYVDAYPEGWSPPPRAAREGEAEGKEREPSLTAGLLPLELHIDATKPFWVRRDDFAVELTAKLALAIAPEKATLKGEVKTLGGFVELVGTRFDVERGAIHFVGDELDPLLDLTALANSGTAAEVRVSITGHLSDPVLAYQDRSGQELTAAAALACISSARCDASATERAETSAGVEALTQQARGQLASITAGLLKAITGRGERAPQISVTAGEETEEVTVRAGFQANRLIPEIFRGFVESLYLEGYVGTAAVEEDGGAAARSARATGGVVIEMRHPKDLVTRGRYEPPESWSLDLTWQP